MWQDSTLRDVAEALRLVVSPALSGTSFSAQDSKLAVSVVFLSQEGRTVFKEVACVSLEKAAGRGGSAGKRGGGGSGGGGDVLEQLGDARKTLRQLQLRPGDLLDVAVLGEEQEQGLRQGHGQGQSGSSSSGASSRTVVAGGGYEGGGRGRGSKRRRGGGGRGPGGGEQGGGRRVFNSSSRQPTDNGSSRRAEGGGGRDDRGSGGGGGHGGSKRQKKN